jgi:hypothetical protein
MTETIQSIDPTLYASVAGMARPLSEKECVFLSRSDDRAHVMTLDVLQAMEMCRGFGTMAQHAQVIQQRIKGLEGQSDAVHKILGHLVSRGLLRSADQAMEKFAATSSRAEADTTGLVIGDQGELLSAAVTAAAVGPEFPWLVIDGSADRASEKVAARIAGIGEKGVGIQHIDRAWRRRLVEHLGRELNADTELLSEGLDSSRAGLWNVGLLLSAGTRVISVDQTFRGSPRQRHTSQSSWSLNAHGSLPMTLVRNDAVFDQALKAAEVGLVGAQLECCGQALGTVASGLEAGSLAGMGWQEVSDLADSKVLMTQPGTWGDVGHATNAWVYQTPPVALPHVAPDRESYYQWLRRPLAAEGFDQWQLSRVADRLPGSLDATSLLPPAPISALESAYGFGAWARFVHPESIVIQMPWMTEYRREATYQPASETEAPALGRFLGEFALFRSDDCAASQPPARMAMLASLYADLAAASDQRLERLLEEFIAGHRSEALRLMQFTINQAGDAPEHWRADAKSWIEHEVGQITAEAVPALREFAGDLTSAQCVEILRAHLDRQTRWLSLWPEIWQYAQDHRQELLSL